MQVIVQDPPDPQAPDHFFFLGLRAPPGQTAGALGTNVERVGVIVLKHKVRMDGSVEGTDIVVKDALYPGITDFEEPLRFESDLSATKPELDVIVVGVAASHGADYGTVEINRVTGPDTAHRVSFGWLSRVDGDAFPPPPQPPLPQPPVQNPRPPFAGVDLDNFQPSETEDKVTKEFDNAFFNGGPVPMVGPGDSRLSEGDEVRFVPDVGTARNLRIPTAPTLEITRDGQLVSVIVPLVDTVVFDLTVPEFLVTWRGVFLWDVSLEDAALEVS